jgi:membrane-associated phospholipid phosphatase
MGASVASAVAVTLLVPYPNTPRWTGGILFDAAVRDALRARTPGLRDGIRTASDLTLATTIVHVTLIDSLIVPLAGHSPDVAFQLLLMDAQAFSLNLVISTLLSKIIARARPAAADCARDPSFDPLCRTSSFASIPSGHTSTAFTAAGLTCVHHAYLPLYGGDGWDTAACVSALSLASATGLFRILGDRHYVSDVILGAALGFSIGYVYPWLFHYIGGANDDSSSVRWGPLPGTAGTPYGASAIGFF